MEGLKPCASLQLINIGNKIFLSFLLSTQYAKFFDEVLTENLSSLIANGKCRDYLVGQLTTIYFDSQSHLIMVLCPISLSVITARPPCFTEDIPLLTSSLSNPGIVSQVVSSQIESNSNTTELGVLYSISQLRFHKKHPPNVGVMELLLVDHHHQDHDQQQEQSTTRSTGARSTGS